MGSRAKNPAAVPNEPASLEGETVVDGQTEGATSPVPTGEVPNQPTSLAGEPPVPDAPIEQAPAPVEAAVATEQVIIILGGAAPAELVAAAGAHGALVIDFTSMVEPGQPITGQQLIDLVAQQAPELIVLGPTLTDEPAFDAAAPAPVIIPMIRVSAKGTAGRYRAGLKFEQEPRDLLLADLTREQQQEIGDDPELLVEFVDGPAAPSIP